MLDAVGILQRLNDLDRRSLGPPVQSWPPEQIDTSAFWDAASGDVVIGTGEHERRVCLSIVRRVRFRGGRGLSSYRCTGPGVKLTLSANQRSQTFLADYFRDRLEFVDIDAQARFQLRLPFTPEQARRWRRQSLLIAWGAAAAVVILAGSVVVGTLK